jgi:hypothetical protein
MDDQRQLELARELRPQLDAVIADDAERRAAATELDDALALSGADRDARLAVVLAARPETRAWMHARDVDPDRLDPLAGRVTAELGTYFVCPEGDYDFVRETVSETVPLCPVHNVPLEPAPM